MLFPGQQPFLLCLRESLHTIREVKKGGGVSFRSAFCSFAQIFIYCLLCARQYWDAEVTRAHEAYCVVGEMSDEYCEGETQKAQET